MARALELLEDIQAATVDKSLCRIDHGSCSVEGVSGIVLVNLGGVFVWVLGAVATSTQSIQTTEYLHPASTVELGSHRINDRDVTPSSGGAQPLNCQQCGSGLSGGVVRELERTCRVVCGTHRGKPGMGGGVGQQPAGYPSRGDHLFELAG